MLSDSGALTPWPGKPPLGMGSPGFPEVSVTDTSESEDKITITHTDLGGSILHFLFLHQACFLYTLQKTQGQKNSSFWPSQRDFLPKPQGYEAQY